MLVKDYFSRRKLLLKKKKIWKIKVLAIKLEKKTIYQSLKFKYLKLTRNLSL